MDNHESFRSVAELTERQSLQRVLVLTTEELRDPDVKDLLDGVSGIYSWSIAPKRGEYEEYARGFSLKDRDKTLESVDSSTGTEYSVSIQKAEREYDRFEDINNSMKDEENRMVFSSVFKRICGPVYIGESQDLKRRLLEHRRTIHELTKDFDWNPDDEDAEAADLDSSDHSQNESSLDDFPKISDTSFLRRIRAYLKSSSSLYEDEMIREDWFFVQVFPFQNQGLVKAKRIEIETALISLLQPIGNKKNK